MKYIIILLFYCSILKAQLTFNQIFFLENGVTAPYSIDKFGGYQNLLDTLQMRGYQITFFNNAPRTNSATDNFAFENSSNSKETINLSCQQLNKGGIFSQSFDFSVNTQDINQYNLWLKAVRSNPNFTRQPQLDFPNSQVYWYNGSGGKHSVMLMTNFDVVGLKVQRPFNYSIFFRRVYP